MYYTRFCNDMLYFVRLLMIKFEIDTILMNPAFYAVEEVGGVYATG